MMTKEFFIGQMKEMHSFDKRLSIGFQQELIGYECLTDQLFTFAGNTLIGTLTHGIEDDNVLEELYETFWNCISDAECDWGAFYDQVKYHPSNMSTAKELCKE